MTDIATVHTPSRGLHRVGRRSIVGVLALCSVLFGVMPTAGAAPTTPAESAQLGAAWVRAALADSVPLDLFGSPNWGVTVDAATALAALDGSDTVLASTWAELVAHRDEVVNDGTDDVPGALAKMILLAHSLGENPRAIGDDPGADLVARLAATLQPSGLYGTQYAAYDGVYRQGLAITALVSAGEAPAEDAIDWLIGQQCTNVGFEGAYMPYRADITVDCEDDPGNWLGADTNAAAMAISALTYSAPDDAAAQNAVEGALGWLDAVQDTNGGWASNSWSGPDANSTAVIVQALIAAGELDADRFNDRSQTPQQFLMSLQIAESEEAGDVGAFNFMAGPDDPNLLATVQAVVATASRALIFAAPIPETPDETTTTTTTLPTDGPGQTGSDDTGTTAGSIPGSGSDRGIGFTG